MHTQRHTQSRTYARRIRATHNIKVVAIDLQLDIISGGHRVTDAWAYHIFWEIFFTIYMIIIIQILISMHSEQCCDIYMPR